jgi:acyl-CoA thioester hydrolase
VISAETIITVQFYDLDPMEIVWHGNYVRYLEQARCALLDKIGFNYEEMSRTPYAWPVVDLRIKFVRPARFGQELRAAATLLEYENRLKIGYTIADRSSGEIATKAHTIQVAVDRATNELLFESPTILIEKVKRWL